VCMSVSAPRSVSGSVSMHATESAFGGNASRVLSLREQVKLSSVSALLSCQRWNYDKINSFQNIIAIVITVLIKWDSLVQQCTT